MRVLLVGYYKHHSIENHFEQFLNKHGAEVIRFDIGAQVTPSFTFKVLRRLSQYKAIYSDLNKRLIESVANTYPDIIWVFKGMEIFPETIKTLKSGKAKVVNYNPDHPFILSSKGSGNKMVTDSVAFYDFHLCYSRNLCEQIESKYNIETGWIPFGFDLKSISPYVRQNEILKLCFIGNPDKKRVETIHFLAEAGILIDVYGHGWSKWIKPHANVLLHDAVYGTQMQKTIQKYRVQLNVFRPHNAGSHNMRTFEIPAAGGIMLAPVSEEHLSFFESNKEAFFYESLEDCVETARHILSLSEDEAEAVRIAAAQRSIKSKYSYEDRAIEVLNFFKSHLKTEQSG